MMRLSRLETSDYGTFGVLTLGAFECFTLEPPDRGNAPRISCIPEGDYEIEAWSSRNYRQALHVLNVPGRDAILVHQGNWAGDREKGLLSNSMGCVLVGMRRAVVKGQQGIALSIPALSALCGIFAGLNSEKLPLEVRNAS